jgi:hypothetical protein
MPVLDGLWWLLFLVGPLILIQRLLHRETQAILLLLTRRAEIALTLFSLLFFPGVFLHEASHYIMALLVGVKVKSVSLLPHVISVEPDGGTKNKSRLQLGFVETSHADVFRDALIGAAPLLVGGIFVVYAGLAHLNLQTIWSSFVLGQGPDNSSIHPLTPVFSSLSQLPAQPDFWLWFYLTFAVSSTMLPSASDRRAWLPLILIGGILLGIGLLAGVGPWLATNLAPALNQGLRVLAAALGISLALHLLLLLPAYLLRKLLVRVTGLNLS